MTTRFALSTFALVAAVLTGACRPAERAASAPVGAAHGTADTVTTSSAATPERVDSVVTREEALRRFRAGAHEVHALTGGAASREALVRDFVRAVDRRDTTALATMLIDRDEFAWLYYPANPQGLPPYDLHPDLMWFMRQSATDKGIGKLFEFLGDRRLSYRGVTCDSVPSRQGANTVWGPCMLHVTVGGDTGSARLFGLILERGGRYKFVDYGNRID